MKILLVNVHSAHNAGDAVLLRVVLAELRRVFPGYTITLVMNDPASHAGPEPVAGSFTAWFKDLAYDANRWRPLALLAAPYLLAAALLAGVAARLVGRSWTLPLPARHRRLLRAYAEADIVVSSAGGYLYSSGRVGLPLLLTAGTIAYGWWLGKPTYGMPQTIGPLARAWERRLVAWLAARMRLLIVRDEESAGLLRNMGVARERTLCTPDLAFLYDALDEQAADRMLPAAPADGRRPRLGVTVIDWGAQRRAFEGQARYEQAVAAAVRAWLDATDGDVIFFPQVCGPLSTDDDRIPARRVAALLADRTTHVTVIEEQTAPSTLRAAYGSVDLLLGTRLHSNIFALTRGVPVVAVAYQPKTFGTLARLGLERYALPIEACEGQALADLLLAGWAARDDLRRQIALALPILQEQAAAAANAVRADARTCLGARV